MRLVVGSASTAKKKYFEELFEDYECEFVLGKDLNIPEPIENGKTSYENALIKARHYAKLSGLPAVALDSSLLFLDFDENDPIQVGCHVKRPQGKALTPLEMRDYYKNLAHEHGGKLRSEWIDAYALVGEQIDYCKDFKEETDEKSGFYLTDEAHEKFNPAQPLDSISKKIASDLFYYDTLEMKESGIVLKEDRNIMKYRSFVSKTVDEMAALLRLERKQK